MRLPAVPLLLLAFAPFVASAQQPAPAMMASEIIGLQVRDPDTGDTGRIDDLVVDVANGRVHFVVLDMPGPLVTQPLAALELGRDGARINAASDWRFAAPQGIALMRASSLVGSSLENEGGARVGTIADLGIDPASGAIAYAAVRLDEDAQNLREVPLGAFQVSPRRDKLVLKPEAEALRARAPAPATAAAGGSAGSAQEKQR